jgi:ubiquinone/menaquinone biosynthesis C-methylase UbiE
MSSQPKHNTSWQNVSSWYHENVGERGNYYHEHVVLPGVIRLLDLKHGNSVLDLACGQGVLARRLPKGVSYTGIDAARSFVEQAQKMDHNPHHQYIVSDVTESLFNNPQLIAHNVQLFTHATIILALQNIEFPEKVLENVSCHLAPNGILVIVLNHPCFRIPRQSSWGIDEASKLQYRRINRYMNPLKIPITAHPGQVGDPSASLRMNSLSHFQKREFTWSFHHPLSDYSAMLSKNGFVIERLEEWTSDKESVGEAAKMENRGRSEFPLFLTIKAIFSPSCQTRPAG